MQDNNSTPVSELRVSKDRKQLTVSYADGETYAISAEILRVLSPSAEVRGHAPDQRKLISGKRNVEIMAVAPVGNYAVRVSFDDMHDTGIYSWSFLRDMGENQENYWREYESELSKNGKSRDR